MIPRRLVVSLASLGVAAGLGYALRAARAAGIPAANAMSYAGLLEDATGPITGMHNIQLYVYDAATAGNILCQSAPAALSVINGRFTVPLPDTCTAAVGTNSDAWIDVLVDGSDTGRTKIGAVPYAVEANHAVNATSAVNATMSTSAGHASTADTATNAVNATNATHASAADMATNATSAVSATNATTVTGAIATGLFDVSSTCTTFNGDTQVNCVCPTGEIAVRGGGFCGFPGTITESANVPMSATTRDLTTWRVSCSSGSPTNYYALCLKTQ
jgi:hypothetical protein